MVAVDVWEFDESLLVEGGADRRKNPATAAMIRIPTTAPTTSFVLAARRRVMSLRKQLYAGTTVLGRYRLAVRIILTRLFSVQSDSHRLDLSR